MTQYDRFGDEIIIEKEEPINGLTKEEICRFVGPNSKRYYKTFEKNKDKKVFVNFNFAALIFQHLWFFYRKMYLQGILTVVIYVAVLLCTAFATYFAFNGEVERARAEYAESMKVISENVFDDYGYSDGKINSSDQVNAIIDVVLAKTSAIIITISAILALLTGMFSDCIYRNYVVRNCRFLSGGVTVSGIVAGWFFGMVFIGIMSYIFSLFL